jgi:hypothetical protein
MQYIAWRYIKGIANRIHYSVACHYCSRELQWRKSVKGAIKAYNETLLRESEG